MTGGAVPANAPPPRPQDLKLKSANQAESFFVTFPRKLKEVFEYARDHPGQFALSIFTSMTASILVRAALVSALGVPLTLGAVVGIAMLTSATISVGRALVDHLYGPPPDADDLAAAHHASFQSVMSKAVTSALWSGAIAGLIGAYVGEKVENFKVPVRPMDGDWASSNGQYSNAYIDAHGRLEPSPLAYDGKSQYAWPVNPESATTIFDNCGERVGRIPGHHGIDISIPEGTPVRSAATGIVTEATSQLDKYGRLVGYGHYIKVSHYYDNLKTPEIEKILYAETRYAHLSEINVKPGMEVTPETIIGRTGNSGSSEGPHLHFEIRGADKTVFNPLQFLPKLPDNMITIGERLGRRIYDVLGIHQGHSHSR